MVELVQLVDLRRLACLDRVDSVETEQGAPVRQELRLRFHL